jgi:hypothetical protein
MNSWIYKPEVELVCLIEQFSVTQRLSPLPMTGLHILTYACKIHTVPILMHQMCISAKNAWPKHLEIWKVVKIVKIQRNQNRAP